MWCNVASLNIDSEVVKMSHFLDTKLVGSALTTDHDIKMQFTRWIDETNLRLYDLFRSGVGEEPQKVSDACANAYGDLLCSMILPNCTYMPNVPWPYHQEYEKIYVCKEVCQKVQNTCPDAWLPHKFRCADFISKQVDLTVDPKWEMTHYARREAGGHACSHVEMTVRYEAGVGAVRPSLALMGTALALLLTYWR